MIAQLHVIPGLAAAGQLRGYLREAGETGRVIGLYDCFDVGAISRHDDPLEVAVRRGRAMVTRTGDAEFAPRAEDDMAALTQAMEAAEGITLWAGETLQEQFALGFMVALAVGRGWGGKLALRQHRMDGIAKCLGVLRTEEFAEVPGPRPLSRDETTLYTLLWEGLQASTPEPLITLRRSPALPVTFRAALDAHFSRFPHVATGLGVREERVLAQLSEAWRPAAQVIGYALAWGEEAVVDEVGDLDLLDLLRGFSRRPEDQPLVEIREGSDDRFGFSARLTPYGAALAGGAASLVEDGGIDVQIGGVRMVSGAGPLWLQTGGAEILSRLD
ncbi:DUF1835 domain-containing protein [Vannielia litorea]|uniref:DUF1835 domain-containing protein n=1 Tax=Vannielia litorea TaxID=1217970 RepID=UPI001C96069D|nr:DUF1835 domain-containing protein [Vannielia litorea]MBY6155650.1 DUF1835 domain-containing protein [Vannielia litorea]